MTTFINIFGGPGSGKSTTAARLFHEMKIAGYDVELVTEVAKDLTWEKRIETLKIQPYVTIKQYRNLVRLKGKVDYVISDSPIVLGLVYADLYNMDLPKSYWDFIRDLHDEILEPSINVLLRRSFKYQENGRNQNEEGAIELDEMIADKVKHLSNVLHLRPDEVYLSTIIGDVK